MTKENELAEGALRHMGFQMKVAEKKFREEFVKLKYKCSHRKPYKHGSHIYICEKMKGIPSIFNYLNLHECIMCDCPLLKGEL